MSHVTPALWAPVEAAYGRPAERTWAYPITEPEIRMVIASTRGQTRVHDVTLFIQSGAGQIALIRKHDYPAGGWRAPGGGINPGESFVQGAAREAAEETGLSVRLVRYLLRVQATFTCGDLTQPWTTHVVLAETDDPEPRTHDPKEIAGVRWGTLNELTGPVAEVLLRSGRGLFRYRVALHAEAARLLESDRQSST